MCSDVNYIRLKKFSIRYRYFLYLDHESRLADSLFIQEKVEVKFLADFAKKNHAWLYVKCRVHKQDEDKFKNSLSKLHDKCLLCGAKGYPAALATMRTMFGSAMGGE